MTNDEQIVKDLVKAFNKWVEITVVSDIYLQCISNGINYERLVEEGCGGKVLELEMFFFGCPRIVGMQYFPNLTKLRIVNQKIGSMKGVDACTNLEELWICEGQLIKIEGKKRSIAKVLLTRCFVG